MKKRTPQKYQAPHAVSVVFQPEPEGGFTVLVPALPGCVTYGKNLSEARAMAREAIELYLETMLEEGESIPQNLASYLGSVEVSLPSRASLVHA